MAHRTLEIRERSGTDGILHLSVPTGEPDSLYRVTVILEPDTIPTPTASEKTWPPGFLETIVGGWTGEFKDGSV